MHLQIIIAYALLIWWPRERPFDPPVASPAATFAVVLALLVLVLVIARLTCAQGMATLQRAAYAGSNGPSRQHMHLAALQWLCLVTFIADVTLTQWSEMVGSSRLAAVVPGLPGLLTIIPFLVALIFVLRLNYPMDRVLRERAVATVARRGVERLTVWNLRTYLHFNVRHQILTIVVPMTLILAGYDLARRFEPYFARHFGIEWAADVVLGFSAAGVFVVAPWLLRHIWTTHALPASPLRDELDAFCRRIGLRFRDILVWRSDGMVVNAAVMGIAGPLRYVLLSDGVIQSLPPRQIEAVFAHEAGHVRHQHIPFFLLFALASMLISSGIMELVYRGWGADDTGSHARDIVTQGIGMLAIASIWAFGFGFISRRFERQADLFGARCVAARNEVECTLPCSVHPGQDGGDNPPPGLCATGADLFCDALESVAALNGIPRREFSWRHASIAHRVQHLKTLAGDPEMLAKFERLIRRIKTGLLVVCIGGLAVGTVYLWPVIVDVVSRGR